MRNLIRIRAESTKTAEKKKCRIEKARILLNQLSATLDSPDLKLCNRNPCRRTDNLNVSKQGETEWLFNFCKIVINCCDTAPGGWRIQF